MTVVWNPWVAKAKALADFGDAEWTQMVCIETCNVSDFAVELRPVSSTRCRRSSALPIYDLAGTSPATADAQAGREP